MHDALTVGIPVLVILFGILLNQKGLDRLDGRIDRVEGRLDRVQTDLTARLDRMQGDLTARLDRMQADLSMFYKNLGEHSARIDNLEKRRSA
jgi:uncharacterized protein YPO0396